jgi:MoxR-like ATPase
MTMSYQVEIARLPIAQVLGAYQKFCQSPVAGITKLEATKWLADRVNGGVLSLADVTNAPRGVAAATAGDPRLEQQVSDILTRSLTLADDLARTQNFLNATTKKTEYLSDKLDHQAVAAETLGYSLDKRIERLTVAVDNIRIDDAAVAVQVQQVIADAFAPFKQAVLDAGAQSVVADLSGVRVIERRTASQVFGLPVLDMKGREIPVDLWNHPSAPDIDPDFIWTAPILRHLLLSQDTGENVWFGGEKGTGKSETARQFAAKTGRGFTRINFHKHTSAEEYIGAVGLKDGATVFEPKDFLLAYTCPSTVILLDEVTNADAGELAPLNGYLEPKAAVSFGGHVHRRAKGVLIFAADNTFGNGDESGRHAGTRVQNSALLDRFARVVQFQFLPVASEIEAIVRHTGCHENIAEHVVSAITVCRAKVESGDIIDAPSIRSAMAFIRALRVLPANEAWQTAVVSRQPSESAAVLNAIFATSIDQDVLAHYL